MLGNARKRAYEAISYRVLELCGLPLVVQFANGGSLQLQNRDVAHLGESVQLQGLLTRNAERQSVKSYLFHGPTASQSALLSCTV